VGLIRDKMVEDMKLRGFSEHTQRCYLQYARLFVEHYGRSPSELGENAFATHLLGLGTNVRVVQELLGHGSARSTTRYTHVSRELVGRIKSPLDVLGTKGGHVDVCNACGYSRPAYNSCRNRHCPKCQSLIQAAWIEQRKGRILPSSYFHVVFTLPAELRGLCRRNAKTLYKLLFQTVSKTLLELGDDEGRLGAQIGFTAVLHTWTRSLELHPHLHCIVTGGGLSPSGDQWIPARRRYLFPVKVLSRLFRGKFLDRLRQLYERGDLDLGGR